MEVELQQVRFSLPLKCPQCDAVYRSEAIFLRGEIGIELVCQSCHKTAMQVGIEVTMPYPEGGYDY